MEIKLLDIVVNSRCHRGSVDLKWEKYFLDRAKEKKNYNNNNNHISWL